MSTSRFTRATEDDPAGVPASELRALTVALRRNPAATVEQFPTIAKLRAARRLWYEVCAHSGASADAGGQRQHAVTARPMLTARELSS